MKKEYISLRIEIINAMNTTLLAGSDMTISTESNSESGAPDTAQSKDFFSDSDDEDIE